MAKKIKSGLKSVARAVKKVASSKLGKVLLAAATIYVGGAALGAWKAAGPLAKVNGILRAGGAAANAGAAGSAGASAAASTATAFPAAANTAAGLTKSAIGAATQEGAKKGIISAMMEGAGSAAASVGKAAIANPIPTAMVMQGAASMAAPDEIDIAREQDAMRLKEEERRRAIADQNMQVGSIDMGRTTGPTPPMQWRSTGQSVFGSGIINSNRGKV